MAAVSFRRGSEQLYRDRWNDYKLNGNQDYAYLENAIYFATDSNLIFLDGECYTFQNDVDLESFEERLKLLGEKTTLKLVGDSGNFVSSIYNGTDSSTGTISYRMGNIADAQLVGYETSTGFMDESETINSAISNLDERTTWLYF